MTKIVNEIQLPAELVINFKTPIEFGGTTYTQVTLVEPMLCQFIEANKARGYEVDVKMISIVGKIPEGVVTKMLMSDYRQGERYLRNFIEGGESTGKVSSPQ